MKLKLIVVIVLLCASGVLFGLLTSDYIEAQSGNTVFLPAILHSMMSETEPNDTAPNANGPLRSQEMIQGKHNDASDYYKFDSDLAGEIRIEMETGDLAAAQEQRIQLILYFDGSAPENRIDNDSRLPYQIIHTGGAGRYYARVYTDPCCINASQAYTLTVSFPANTPTPTSTPTLTPTGSPTPTPTSTPTPPTTCRSNDFIMLLDGSRSMDDDAVMGGIIRPFVRQSLDELALNHPGVRVGFAMFDDNSSLVYPPTDNYTIADIVLQSVWGGGGNQVHRGLETAQAALADYGRSSAGHSILLITDGFHPYSDQDDRPYNPSDDSVTRLVAQVVKDAGINIYVIAIPINRITASDQVLLQDISSEQAAYKTSTDATSLFDAYVGFLNRMDADCPPAGELRR